MELKEGYKQTEVGVIPKDWEVTSLSTLGKFKKGKGVKKAEANSGTLPCVRYGELYTIHNDIIREARSGISEAVAKESESVEFGDVLFAGSGETKAEIGKCASYVLTEPGFAGGDIVVFTAHRQDPFFLGYALNVPAVQGQKAAMGQGDAVVHIHASHLSRLKVSLPPIQEQQAISKVLSDVDAEIAQAEMLVEKLKAKKAALSQKLLSGEIRLNK